MSKTQDRVWEKYAQGMAGFYGPAAQAKRLREEADRYDNLAARARCDGDFGDEMHCKARAAEARRKARRCEANT